MTTTSHEKPIRRISSQNYEMLSTHELPITFFGIDLIIPIPPPILQRFHVMVSKSVVDPYLYELSNAPGKLKKPIVNHSPTRNTRNAEDIRPDISNWQLTVGNTSYTLDQIYKDYQQFVLGRAIYRSRNLETADGLASMAWMNIISSKNHSFESREQLILWLSRVVDHVVYDINRKKTPPSNIN